MVEVADDRVHRDARVLGGDGVGGRTVASLTTNGMNRASCPDAAKASSKVRVLSDVPDPSSTMVSAPLAAAMAAASARRMPRSVSVG
jgi:hypothetical protein